MDHRLPGRADMARVSTLHASRASLRRDHRPLTLEGLIRTPHVERMAEAIHPWMGLTQADPTAWLLESEEEPARWLTITGLSGIDEEQAEEERDASVSSEIVRSLIGTITPWDEAHSASGHNSPGYLPNLLHLLADLGARAGDDVRIEAALDQLGARQRSNGGFLSFGRAPRQKEPMWGSLPCDTHTITEVLVRFGRHDAPATRRGLERMAEDLTNTSQGLAWTCVPDPDVGFRGPGRKGDLCPQVTLEALRTFARLPHAERPSGLEDAARTVLDVWRRRETMQPYMFGHGYRFKTVKWPPNWYGVYWMLDALGRYPGLWAHGPSEDRRSLAELARCAIDYNVSEDGTVTPRSVFRGFERFSFGQKRLPSPIATAMLSLVVRRLSDLRCEIEAVDVITLASSKGGSGTARPPRR